MIKNNFRILKKQYVYLQTILKTPVKFQKDWPKTVGGVADTRMVVGADGRTDGRTDVQTDRRTDGRTDTQNLGGYNIIPCHFLVAGHKNEVITFFRLFLIGSFSNLQVMRTYIKAYMSLDFGQIPPLTTELAALERLKNRCHHIISVDIDPIFFKFAGNKVMHNIMNEFEFWPGRTTNYGVSCPWASKKYPHRLIIGKMVFPLFLCCFWLDPFDTLCNKNKH